MYLPGPRLIRLLLIGAPLWLLAAVIPGMWMPGAAWIAALFGLSVVDLRSAPRRADFAARRELPGRFSYGEPHVVGLCLENHSAQGMKVVARDEVPDVLETVSQVFEADLPPGGEARFTLEVRPRARGIHAYGDVLIRATWGFGLLQREFRLKTEDRIRVYPRFRGLDGHRLLARIAQRDEAVRRPRRIRGQGSDTESLRAYVTGDDPRQIDWKISARRSTLIARQRQVEKGQQLAFLVDVGRLMGGTIGGHSRLEHALNAVVGLSYVVQKRGDTLALAAFSNKIEAFVPNVRGQQILPRVLDALCTVEVQAEESDYWHATAEVMALLRRRSLVIFFTDVLDVSGSSGLLNNMRRAAARHIVLCVVMIEPRLQEIARDVPATSHDVWKKAAACDLLRRRRLALEHMKGMGIQVLETSPEHLSVHVIQRYLEIRQADLQ